MTRALAITLSLLPSLVFAKMRDDEDRRISRSLIERFRIECNHRSNLDRAKITELQAMYEKVSHVDSEEGKAAFACYQSRMSQISGIHHLYRDLCAQVSDRDINWTDDESLKVLYMFQKYTRGILPFHDLLNDCIREKSSGEFVVATARFKTEGASLRKELDKLEIKPPFEPGRVEYR